MCDLVEDLPRLARDAYGLADRYCVDCRDFHALWPYVRLARASAAAEGGRSVVEPLLRGLIDGGLERILIAGAADTGLLALVARAGGGRTEITVVDRCQTPLELCRHFAAQHRLPVMTLRADLRSLELDAAFDLVFVHSLLQFIEPPRRVGLLSRLCQAVAPSGRMVMVSRSGRRIDGGLVEGYRAGYPDWVMGELHRKGVSLPAPALVFRDRLLAYAKAREAREGAFSEIADIGRLVEEAGFDLESVVEFDAPLEEHVRKLVARLGKRRFVMVARPSDRAAVDPNDAGEADV